ncbi:hypothetical protein CspeluHIS016_0107440 [Cutaneotrichosporon spelunceum]|uniref:Thioredoxin-like protein n=1 Tax=Cutaneotrichosporon spelunceum TaxID=1672016 RepID=A0AAD3Y9M9_9TREE|nr:hypothetical protein CspeluHIS016_0107440 [Cutaneotrichosporon spelunceum]
MSFFSAAGTSNNATGANNIPAPASDDDKNVPQADAATRIKDFVKEDPIAIYTFDSRVIRDEHGEQSQQKTTDLCRRRRDGSESCVKVAAESKALFKMMQTLGFYCALPAEPTETHMECRMISRSSPSALTALEIPYEAFDLAIDEDAKRRWQRTRPTDRVIGLPGYLVGGEWIGTMDDFEEAVETGQLEKFLKQDMVLADVSQTIGEAELDRLMREMTDADLDQLVCDLSVDDEPHESSGGLLAGIKDEVDKVASAAGAFVDEATGQSALEAPSSPKEGPKPGEKTLDEVIDETMAKEKEEYEEEKEEKKEEEEKEVKKEKKEKEEKKEKKEDAAEEAKEAHAKVETTLEQDNEREDELTHKNE